MPHEHRVSSTRATQEPINPNHQSQLLTMPFLPRSSLSPGMSRSPCALPFSPPLPCCRLAISTAQPFPSIREYLSSQCPAHFSCCCYYCYCYCFLVAALFALLMAAFAGLGGYAPSIALLRGCLSRVPRLMSSRAPPLLLPMLCCHFCLAVLASSTTAIFSAICAAAETHDNCVH